MRTSVASLDSLCLEAVQIHYDESALHAPVSCCVHPGSWIALQGESGLGKTSLLRAALGFCEDWRGRVLINGRELSPESATILRADSGYLPQRPYLGSGRVREMVEELVPGGYAPTVELADQLGLPARLWDNAVDSLSGGELQRLSLALVLARRPRLAFLDEPSAALDGLSRARLINLLQTFTANGGGGMLISHDEQILEAVADQVIELQEPGESL